MAALATTLTEFSDNGDSRTYTVSGHTASQPKLVLEKRKVPVGNQTMSEFACTVVYGTKDADGAVLPQKISLGTFARYPVNGDSSELATDLAAALVILQDVVQSDEFEASITSQNWIG